MNKSIFFGALVVTALVACKGQNQQTPAPAPTTPAPAAQSPAKKMTERPAGAVTRDMTGVKFASNHDPVCGMPLKAGIEDTVHYKGKIYGFCAEGCKEEFVKDPAGALAQQ